MCYFFKSNRHVLLCNANCWPCVNSINFKEKTCSSSPYQWYFYFLVGYMLMFVQGAVEELSRREPDGEPLPEAGRRRLQPLTWKDCPGKCGGGLGVCVSASRPPSRVRLLAQGGGGLPTIILSSGLCFCLYIGRQFRVRILALGGLANSILSDPNPHLNLQYSS